MLFDVTTTLLYSESIFIIRAAVMFSGVNILLAKVKSHRAAVILPPTQRVCIGLQPPAVKLSLSLY